LYAAAYLPIKRYTRFVGRPRLEIQGGKPSLLSPHFAIIFCYHPVFTIIYFTINIICYQFFYYQSDFTIKKFPVSYYVIKQTESLI
jgi:hypothetical protein